MYSDAQDYQEIEESLIDFEEYLEDTPEKNDGEGSKANMRLLKDLVKADNIVEMLDEEDEAKIAAKCIKGYKDDLESMKDWLDYANRAMELTQLPRQEKHTPWRNAANVKLPMITQAVLQFASRSESEMIKNGQIAKYKVIGHDPDGRKQRKGMRNAMHINYQIQEKIPGWHNQHDQMQHQLAVVGTAFTKTYYDPLEQLIRSDYIPYNQIVVNMGIKSLKEAPRITQIIEMQTDEMIAMMRAGYFCNLDLDCISMDKDDPEAINHELIEQHCKLDLDGDGLAEPYIVTIHLASEQLLRIVARYTEKGIQKNKKGQIQRISPINYFVDWIFIPDPAGGFWGYGFGTLLLDINVTSNTLVNQLINAGTLATSQTGLLDKNLRIKKEDMELDPGTWITAEVPQGMKIQDLMTPLSYKEPSTVLLQLFTLFQDIAKGLSATTDVLTGQQDTTNTSPNTLAALQSESLKVYSAIRRRIMRSGKRELELIVVLDAEHVNEEEYIKLVSPSPQEMQEIYHRDEKTGKIVFVDYDLSDIAIIPVVDENDATEQEDQLKAQVMLQTAQISAQIGAINPRAQVRYAYQLMNIEPAMIDKIIAPDPPPNQPNPQMVELQMKHQTEMGKLQVSQQKNQIHAAEAESKIKLHDAQAVKTVADAQAIHTGVGIKKAEVVLNHHMDNQNSVLDMAKINSGLVQQGNQHQHEQAQQQADATLQSQSISQRPLEPDLTLLPHPDVVHKEAVRRGWIKKESK